MAYVPDICYLDAKTELVSETGHIKHAALTLYGYYCVRRNGKTGLAFPKLPKTVEDTGIPKSNVSMLKTFLKTKGWIHVYDTGVIRPLKGFYTDEQIFKFRLREFFLHPVTVLIIRTLVLKNRTLVLIIRTLFKGSINQPNEPAQLTSVEADAARADAANAPDDKKSEDQPAGKPAPQAPARKPADERINHPAVAMVKQLTGRFPPKDLWDRIIREIRGKPDIEFFRKCWEVWRSVGGNPQNFEQWLFEPNQTGMPPEIFNSKNGRENPPDAPKNVLTEQTVKPLIPLDEHVLRCHLFDFQALEYSGDELSELKDYYTPEAWAWLMKEMERCRLNATG